MDYLNLNLPVNSKIGIWKNKTLKYVNIYIVINKKKFIFSIKEKKIENVFIDKWSNSIIFLKKNQSLNKIKTENLMNKFFSSIIKYYYNKIKFKGKGFRIKILRKNKIIKFYFGRSHITIMFLKKVLKKRINKYKFILKSINKNSLNKLSKIITNIKIFNVYTLRGLRASKQIIFKRKGKKGTYI